MKKIVLFPGQGYQNINMLTNDVQNFCFNHNLGFLVNEVLKDNSKLFDTKYAQPLIVATQLVEYNKYKSTQPDDTEYIYAGFSLGEITALIASGAIRIEDGLEFARQRGELAKRFSEKDLQQGVSTNQSKRTFSVARIPYYENLEADLSHYNVSQPTYNKINITNFIPDSNVSSSKCVTITSETETLRNHLELFGGSTNQKTATMQCPFHTEALSDLIPLQMSSFYTCIHTIQPNHLSHVFSTRTGTFYTSKDTKASINESLGKYLIEPMQTVETLTYLKKNFPTSEIIVSMGKPFSQKLSEQYQSIGGNPENVHFIGDVTKQIQDSTATLDFK